MSNLIYHLQIIHEIKCGPNCTRCISSTQKNNNTLNINCAASCIGDLELHQTMQLREYQEFNHKAEIQVYQIVSHTETTHLVCCITR